MKRKFAFVPLVLTIGMLVLYVSSCTNKEHDPPGVFFNNTPPYIYDDTTITHGQVFTIYLQGTKEALNDLLESGTIATSINGSRDSIIQSMNFVSTQINEPYSYTAGAAGTTQKFVFTFYTQSGVAGADSLILSYN